MPTNGINTRMADEALAYATRGVLILPLYWLETGPDGRLICACRYHDQCGKPGKHPRTAHGLDDATTDERQIEAWWSMWPGANIGMPMGANGLAAIDVDPGHGGDASLTLLDQHCTDHGIDMWATRLIRSGGGGLHFIYWQPPGGIITRGGGRAFGNDKPGIDTRGRGGYLVAPPSRHASGDQYAVIENGHTIAPWPEPLTALLEPEPPAARRVDVQGNPWSPAAAAGDLRTQKWAAAALNGECEKLAAVPLGEGHGKHDALNRAAYKIGRIVAAGHLNPGDAHSELLAVAARWKGHPDAARVIAKAFREAAANPHPGPATRGVSS